MEESVNKYGRPPADDPKIHPPRIRLTESSIKRMEEIGTAYGKTQSEVYQEAIDRYIDHIDNIRRYILR